MLDFLRKKKNKTTEEPLQQEQQQEQEQEQQQEQQQEQAGVAVESADDKTVEAIMAEYYDELNKTKEGEYKNNLIKKAIVRIAKLYYSHKGKFSFSSARVASNAELSDPGKKIMEDTMLALWILALYQLEKPDIAKKMMDKFGKFNALEHDVTKPFVPIKGVFGKRIGPFMTYIGAVKGYGGIWLSNSDNKHSDVTLKQIFTDDNITKTINDNKKGWDRTVTKNKDKIINDATKLTDTAAVEQQNGGRKHKKTLKRKSKKGKKTMKKKGKKSKKKVGKKNKKTMKKKKGKKSKKSKKSKRR